MAAPGRRLRARQWIRWKDSSSGRPFARMLTLNLALSPHPPSNLFLTTPTFHAETLLKW
ncbi:hypothetical protein M2272_001485 [Mycobacterium frederiksbergense]|uniref:Uncharacterized protein n=1 Tax=Mycolicibacterium frederiksbergense TaxID=117567 RepID=A0ABT6KVZ3_9MYCO|nr:hypothetical protein [Mycolicibacterium frederiksbergense]